MGIQVEIPQIGTYVYLTLQGDAKVYEVTQTETFQVSPGEFRTHLTCLACDAEGNELGEDPVRFNLVDITEM